jgi:hypothetical protein
LMKIPVFGENPTFEKKPHFWWKTLFLKKNPIFNKNPKYYYIMYIMYIYVCQGSVSLFFFKKCLSHTNFRCKNRVLLHSEICHTQKVMKIPYF